MVVSVSNNQSMFVGSPSSIFWNLSIDHFFSIKRVLAKKNFAIEQEVIQGLIRLLLPFKELLLKLQTTLTPSLHFVLIGICGLRSTLSSFDALLEYERTHKTYSQKESLSSLDFDGCNSIHEDEGSLVNSFFSFNCLFESQMI